MKLAAAARQLRMAASTVGLMAKNGELVVDPETDTSGARFVTRSSVEAAWMDRQERRKPRTGQAAVTVAEVARFIGHTTTELVDLVKAGVLEQVPGRRQLLLTAASLRAWMIEDGPGHAAAEMVAGVTPPDGQMLRLKHPPRYLYMGESGLEP
jgi:hypothetical protein